MKNAQPGDKPDTPLDIARCCVDLFFIQTYEIWQESVLDFIPRHMLGNACAFLRAVEAIVRRIFMVFAVAMLPELPPAKPSRAGKARVAPPPADGEAKTKTVAFKFMAPVVAPVAVKARVPAIARPPVAPDESALPKWLVDARPLGRRVKALLRMLDSPEASARRFAFRVRALWARGVELYYDYGPKLRPEHEPAILRLLIRFSEDANDILRRFSPLNTS